MKPAEKVKKPYLVPRLSRYGSLTDMTAGMKTTLNGDNGGKDAHKTQ
jgi:hypothetical protein